jgi:pilus assembly protein CpaE
VQTFFTPVLPVDPAELFGALNQEPLEVLILGPEVPVEDAMRLATVLNVQVPELSVLLVAEPQPEFILQAMRSGIRDIMSPSADMAEIRVTLERACQSFATRQRTSEPKPSGAPKGLVIGVFSPKGGVGKTTIATNIAVGLGKIAPMSVVIVDLDLQFGDVASGLYLNPEHTVTDAVTPSASQDSLVLKAFLTVHPASIYALCAPKNPVEADEITPEQVGRLLEQLAEEFQYVVVDTAPGLPEIGLAALEQCTDAVWVSAMDVPSVRGLRSGLDILRKLNLLPETRHVVLNMADSKSGLSVQDVESTVGAPVDVSIPRSKAVALSTNRGIPVLQEGTKDPAIKGLNHLVQRFNPAWRASAQRKLHRRVVVQ